MITREHPSSANEGVAWLAGSQNVPLRRTHTNVSSYIFQRITYARSASNATLQHEDPDAVIAPSKKLRKEDRTIASRAQGAYEDLERERLDEEEGRGKRERAANGDVEEQSDEAGDEPDKKKRKVEKAQDGADADEEEMEMDDE